MKNKKINTSINKKKFYQTIMIVGNYSWFFYQEACAVALEKLGFSVIRFSWFDDFWKKRSGKKKRIFHSFWHKLQFRFSKGPIIWKINKRLIECAYKNKPNIIWFYNVHLIDPKIIMKLKKLLPKTTFVQYANDNPFSFKAIRGFWRNFIKSIPLFDIHLSYRENDIIQFKKYGAKSVHVLRSYFIPEEDYHVDYKDIPEKFKCDVVFVGHYENDGRLEMLEAISKAEYKLNLFGPGWNKVIYNLSPKSPLKNKLPISPVIDEEYRYAISGAKVALCFLSKLNFDTYTRRNFQIPAMRTAMLSEWSEDLSKLFTETKDCDFFRDKSELIKKLEKLILNHNYRLNVANSGYYKVYQNGHSVDNRMKLLKKILSL